MDFPAGAHSVRRGNCVHRDDARRGAAVCGGSAVHAGDIQYLLVGDGGEDDFLEDCFADVCGGGVFGDRGWGGNADFCVGLTDSQERPEMKTAGSLGCQPFLV